MRFSTIILLFAPSVLAFSAATLDHLDARAAGKYKRQAPPDVTFNPVKQKVDVSGQHAFAPAKAGDQRGPCPGLNALANHGYLPRSGVTSFAQAVEATTRVFGMGPELAILLSGYATIFDGNLLTLQWSIGGAAKPLPSVPQGLSGSHNKFEGDASPTRSDAFLNKGDVSTLNLTFFKQLYDLQPEGPGTNFDYDTLIKHRVARRQDSISNNPNFFYGPFTGVIGLPAAYAFINRYMSNHSAEAPGGILNHDVLKSFYGVSGNSSNLTYQWGHERIPDNWYRRNSAYGLVPYIADIAYAGIQHPEFLSIGGNTGTVNSFAGIDLGNLTGGIYNLGNLLEGNNLLYFVSQAAQQLLPDVLKSVLSGLTSNLGLSNFSEIPVLGGAGCLKMAKFNQSALKTFPGAE